MAKSSVPKPGGTSRIRVIMVDAEIADGDITAVTQAIANAFRSSAPVSPARRLAAPPVVGNSAPVEEHEPEDEFEDVEAEEAASPSAQKAKGPRKPVSTPDVLTLDFNTAVPLSSFVSAYKTESHQQRFLVAAAWFHDHGDVTKVTPAHIYTAYRFLKWPLNLKDFGQPLRDMKAQKLFGTSDKGTYTINHVGIQRVAELKIGSAD